MERLLLKHRNKHPIDYLFSKGVKSFRSISIFQITGESILDIIF